MKAPHNASDASHSIGKSPKQKWSDAPTKKLKNASHLKNQIPLRCQKLIMQKVGVVVGAKVDGLMEQKWNSSSGCDFGVDSSFRPPSEEGGA